MRVRWSNESVRYMPNRDVKTIRDLIYYQYAKIIARRAFGAVDGKEAKKQSYISRQKIYSLELRMEEADLAPVR